MDKPGGNIYIQQTYDMRNSYVIEKTLKTVALQENCCLLLLDFLSLLREEFFLALLA